MAEKQKKLGLRQTAIIDLLRRRGPTTLDVITEAIYSSPYRRSEARTSVKLLEERGLVEVERSEQGEVLSVSLVA
jgi:DNA-binding MarR family transcriptional regulator